MNSGPDIGIAYYVTAAATFLFGVNTLKYERYSLSFILLLVFAATLIYWGYRFRSLYCLGCASCG